MTELITDPATKAEILKRAEDAFRFIEEKDPSAAFNLALLLISRGKLRQAEERLKKAALAGYQPAIYELGALYERESEKIPQKKSALLDKAIEWYKDSAAKGNKIAEEALGSVFEKKANEARAVKEKASLFEQAFQWYTKAAEHDNAYAAYRLGMLYLKMDDLGNAAKWLKTALDKGVSEAEEQLNLLYERHQRRALSKSAG